MLRKIKYFLLNKNQNIQIEFENYLKLAYPARPDVFHRAQKLLKLNARYRFFYPLLKLNLPAQPLDLSIPSALTSPESSVSPVTYLSPLSLALALSEYDAVSLDIFDTLLFRPFAKPAHLFYCVEEKLGHAFIKQRQEAESEARRLAALANGSREVTLDDIYAVYAKMTGFDPEPVKQMELQAEMDLCFANPFMKIVYRSLKDHGTRLFITSDMYLPHDTMAALLEKNGYTGYEALLVSCDYRASKHDRGLYSLLLEKAGQGSRVAHVGDNTVTDLENAAACGITAFPYLNVNKLGESFRATAMSDIVGSAYAGIVNSTLHNGLEVYDPYYEYGFVAGGLYVLGYCEWIHQRAQAMGLERILFLARDGAIYKRVYDSLFQDIPSEYVYWSRVAGLRYCADVSRNEFIRRVLIYKAYSPQKVTVLGMLRSLKLDGLMPQLAAAGFQPNELIDKPNLPGLKAFFTEHWPEVVRLCEPEALRYGELLKSQIAGAKKVAVVDVGWAGTGPLGVKDFVERKLALNCEVTGFMAGASITDYSATNVALLKGDLETYLFSQRQNYTNFTEQMRRHNSTMCVFFEMLTQDTTPSFKGIAEDGTLEFGVPEVENYAMIRRIHQGIYDFAMAYAHTFQNYPMFLNISGHDAYQPFNHYLADLSHIRKDFLDFTFTRGIGSDENTQVCETLGDLLTKLGLGKGA